MTTTETTPDDVRSGVVSGARWVLILNISTLPLSLLTSMALGNVSAEALGYYGAIQLFVSTSQTFFVLGGPQVFARFVPAMLARDRVPFLLSYTSLVLGTIGLFSTVAFVVVPEWVERSLARVGAPSIPLSLAIIVAVTLLAFTAHFLFGILRGAIAAISQRVVLLGFFIVAAVGATLFRRELSEHPAVYLWTSALFVYGLAAAIGITHVVRLETRSSATPFRWMLPQGFWPVVCYSHLVTMVNFVYQSLSPLIVLIWIDVVALGYLHAALRYQVIVRLVPVLLSSVLAPGLSRLSSHGHHSQAKSHTRFAIDTSLLLATPLTIGLGAFAEPAMRLFGAGFEVHANLLRLLVVGFMAGPVVHLGSGFLVAIGAFRSYLTASMVYVVTTVALTIAVVGPFGLPGAALAATIGALLQQSVIQWLIRRETGLRLSGRLAAAWIWAGLSAGISAWLSPNVWGALAIAVACCAGFARTGGVSLQELRRVVRLMMPGR